MLVTVVVATLLMLASAPCRAFEKHCAEASAGAQSAAQTSEYQVQLPPGELGGTFGIPDAGNKKGVHVWACDNGEPPQVTLAGLDKVYVERHGIRNEPATITITTFFD